MKKLINKLKKINWKKVIPIAIAIFLIAFVSFYCLRLAKNLEFNQAPDEYMRFDIVNYISEHLSLPHGADESIRNPIWGFSYAFLPMLPTIFSGLLAHVATLFSSSFKVYVFAARLVSVFSVIGYTFFVIKISKKLTKGIYRYFFMFFATLIPQILYLGSYVNNDSFTLFTVSIIIYAWLTGLEEEWSWKSCIMLGIGIGLCALSYYNAYGFILCSFFLYLISSFIDKISLKRFFIKGFAILGIVLAISGWWFVRSYQLYGGDFLGLNALRESGETYAEDPYKPSKRMTMEKQGYSLEYMINTSEWKETTRKSFYGIFGYMRYPMQYETNLRYEVIATAGLAGFLAFVLYRLYLFISEKYFKKKLSIQHKIPTTNMKLSQKTTILLYAIMLISAVIPVILSIYNSYYSDFQPQGRYILPMIITLTFFIAKGYEFILQKNKVARYVIFALIFFHLVYTPLYVYNEIILKNLIWFLPQ